jgi:hypothetical protein
MKKVYRIRQNSKDFKRLRNIGLVILFTNTRAAELTVCFNAYILKIRKTLQILHLRTFSVIPVNYYKTYSLLW